MCWLQQPCSEDEFDAAKIDGLLCYKCLQLADLISSPWNWRCLSQLGFLTTV